jgi:hypothetical protein
MSDDSDAKRTKVMDLTQETEDLVEFTSRRSQVVEGPIHALTIKKAIRGDKPKKEVFAMLTEEQKNKIYAKAFHVLVKEISDMGGDEAVDYLREFVEDVIEDEYDFWDKQEAEQQDEKDEE